MPSSKAPHPVRTPSHWKQKLLSGVALLLVAWVLSLFLVFGQLLPIPYFVRSDAPPLVMKVAQIWAAPLLIWQTTPCFIKEKTIEWKLRQIPGITSLRMTSEECHVNAHVTLKKGKSLTFIDLYDWSFEPNGKLWVKFSSNPEKIITPLSSRLERIEQSKQPGYTYSESENLYQYRILPIPLHSISDVIKNYDAIMAILNTKELQDIPGLESGPAGYYIY